MKRALFAVALGVLLIQYLAVHGQASARPAEGDFGPVNPSIDAAFNPAEYADVLRRAHTSPRAFSDFLKTERARALVPYLLRDLKNAKADNSKNHGMRYIEHFNYLRSSAVTISMKSTPSAASVSIYYRNPNGSNGSLVLSPSTNAQVSLFVGAYNVQMTKAGYKLGTMTFSLAYQQVSTVNCTMIKTTVPWLPTICH